MFAMAAVAGLPGSASATHERATLITWAPTSGNAVEFTITGAWRRSAYSTGNSRCRDVTDVTPPVLRSIPCTGADGYAGVGDVIIESLGGTQFDPGQGSLISSPLGALLYVVTAVDPANDWLYATAIDPSSLPAIDTTIAKAYSDSSPKTAFIQDCCRVSNDPGGTQHINNPDANYRIETQVTPGSGNRPPVSSMPPVVLCPRNGPCTFQIPATDADGDPLTYRLSSATEASGSPTGFDQPGLPDAPNAAAVGPTGVYTWDTTGANLGGSGTTYYSTQVTIEDRDGSNTVKSKIAVDFLIQLVDQAGVPPVFDEPPTPECGSAITVNPGALVSFTVQASDVDSGQTVTLNAVGLPSGASVTPPLPRTANPVSSLFSWPTGGGDAGTTHVITFTATDSSSLQASCSITVNVNQCQTDDDCADNSLCTTNVCDPGNPNANAGGCVSTNVVCGDACQTCDPGVGCTGAVCTPVFSPTATVTPTVTQTATATPTPTSSATGTVVPTATFSVTPTVSSTPTATPIVCGNGLVEPGEQCDDGNALDGDGCDSDCQLSAECDYAPGGSPAEVFVGGCGAPSYADVASAIAAVGDGDIVSVCPGTYTVPVVVTREVTLRATGGPAVTTLHVTSGPAIDVRRSGVRVEGFTIQADTGAAVTADAICPLGAASCSPPFHGSNVWITGNRISNSPVGISWQRRIDCATISNNTITGAGAAVVLDQQDGDPALLVRVGEVPCQTAGPDCEGNTLSGGGGSGRLIRVAGLNATVAGNVVEGSSGTGIEVGPIPPGASISISQNEIRDNAVGVTVLAGGAAALVQSNNITYHADGQRHVGLRNESGGTVDARRNWWNSDSGPHYPAAAPTPHPVDGKTYAMAIEDGSAGSTTLFIEFLCGPQPSGDISVAGVCDQANTAEINFVVFGRAPDISPHGKYISFVSSRDANRDLSVTISNRDLGDEVFFLNRTPSGRRESFCIGGKNPGADCDHGDPLRREPCAGSSVEVNEPQGLTQPPVVKGTCSLISQISDEESGSAQDFTPRVTANGNLVFASTAALDGSPGGGSEIFRWRRKDYRKSNGSDPASVIRAVTDATSPGLESESPAVSYNGRYVLVESTADPLGDNPDHNREIFRYDIKGDGTPQVTQVTQTTGAENRRPQTASGKQVLFDSDADLVGENPLNFRQVFYAVWHGGSGWELKQLTHTPAGVENWAGGLAQLGRVVVFSSNGDLSGQNGDGNRELFSVDTRTGGFTQITNTQGTAVENVNPTVNPTGRFIAFESNASPVAFGTDTISASNRNVYLYDRNCAFSPTPGCQVFKRLSKRNIGDNLAPRISKGRFVVWESTANLTDLPGGNPNGEHVIYLYDRRRDD